MTFQSYPIDPVGESNTSRSRQLTSQTCINLYPEIVPTGRTPRALMPTPGCAAWSTGSGTGRGLFVFNDRLFKVTDSTLYSVDSAGGQTSIGTISGSARCVAASNDLMMMITTGGTVYSYNGSTLTAEGDVDFQNPDAVAYLNSRWIYDGNGGQFVTSDVDDGGDIDSLNYAEAEMSGDALVRPYVFNQLLYLFGTQTAESWYNSGVGTPPYDRIEGGALQVGIAGVHAICNTDEVVYFLGSDRAVYRMSGYQAQSIASTGIANSIESFTTVSDCISFSYRMQGQWFVVFQFPTAGKTFVFCEGSGAWVQWSSDVSGGRHIATAYAYCYGKHLVEDGGNIHELSLTTYTDNGVTIARERTLPTLTSSAMGLPGQRLMMGGMTIICETGVGLISGQGSDPRLMISVSGDGGQTFGVESWVSIGRMGDYTKKVRWDHIESFYDGVIKLRYTEPTFFAIHGASIDLSAGGY